jgi:hypothetical protein
MPPADHSWLSQWAVAGMGTTAAGSRTADGDQSYWGVNWVEQASFPATFTSTFTA